jgi:hypothetical protein
VVGGVIVIAVIAVGTKNKKQNEQQREIGIMIMSFMRGRGVLLIFYDPHIYHHNHTHKTSNALTHAQYI